MKVRVTFFAVLLVASLFAAVFTLSDVHGQQPQYGPNIDHIKFTVIKGHAAQVAAMLLRQIDILTDLTDPNDISTLSAAGRKIISTPGDNFYYIGFNMRPYTSGVPPKPLPFGLQNGGNPGLALRHAIAHLLPKAMLIGSLFRYVCTQVDVPMSAALGTFGADIDTHPYNPTMARNILLAGGWTYSGGVWHVPAVVPPGYPLPPGSVLPTIEFMSLTMEASLPSWVIVETTAQNMRNIGITVDHREYDLTTMINKIDTRNYEMYFFYHEDMGRFGDHLYYFFHSANDVPAGTNRPGLRNDDYDDVAWDMYTTLDKAYMEQKVKECLEMLMGTSSYQNTPNTDGLIPCIPFYSRTHFDAYDERLCGIVNAKLKGSWNYWTVCNLDWNPNQPYSRPSDLIPPLPAGNNMVIFCWGDDPQYPANPASVSSTVTWDMLEYVYEGLIGMNPYNLRDRPGWLDLTRDPDPNTTPGYTIIPWNVTDGPAAGEDGMKVTFYLNTTITRDWHDGHNWDAYDVAFAWEYLTANKIPRAWNTFMYFHHCTIEDASTITAYMTTTSLVLPYRLSEWSSMFPEHVWGCCQARDGRATSSCVLASRKNAWDAQLSWINSPPNPGTAGTKPITDPDAGEESGLCLCAESGSVGVGGKLTCIHDSGCVLDHRMTAINEILDYNPSAYAWAISEYPWLTEQIGTGPVVFYQINLQIRPGRGDLIAFDARTQAPVPTIGVHYPKTTNEIHNEKVMMFWELGDANLDGRISIMDVALMSIWYMQTVPPAPWTCDINKDGIVDIRDMSYCGLNYGEEREVDP